jgi:hypothetical protein
LDSDSSGLSDAIELAKYLSLQDHYSGTAPKNKYSSMALKGESSRSVFDKLEPLVEKPASSRYKHINVPFN